MNRYFKAGQEMSLGEGNDNYVIREVIGRGSSCAVYLADHTDKSGNVTEHILKEYNPKSLCLGRNDLGCLTTMNESDFKAFSEGLKRFEAGMQKQLELRRCDELKNYTSNIQSFYYENGTLYIDMTVTSGTSYQHMEEKSLYDLMRRMKVLTHVIGVYHSKGYLHLDIKPENIYVRPENETCEDILLFDFDSVTSKSEIEKAMLSYTQQWAAIEQLLPNRHNRICEATDIFAIGEIIFYKLTGRHSENTERSMLTEISLDYSTQIFENVDPRVMPLLKELFRKTLCNSVNKRYQSTAELEAQLEKIILLSDPQKPFLVNNVPSCSAFFVGREREIEEMHDKLGKNDIVFLSGVGGIGKTELVKRYAHKYKNCYDTIIFAPYIDSMMSLIINDVILPIHNFFCYPKEKNEQYYNRKLKKIKELCDKRTLFIVDNLDDEEAEISVLSDIGCKLLITTRMDFSDIYPESQIDISSVTNPIEVFNEYYKKPLSDEEQRYINEIIDMISGHTITIELLAKQMMAGRIKPQQMLDKLREGGISESGSEKVRIVKDGNITIQNTYGHIKALFDISGLEENEKYILSNLSLVPVTGISTEKFFEWCEIKNYDEINDLIRQGWIMYNAEKECIFIHSLVGELFLNNAVYQGDKIPFLKNLCIFIFQNKYKTVLTRDDNGQLMKYHCDDYDEYYDVLPSIIMGITQNLCKLVGYTKQKIDYLQSTMSLFQGEDSVRNSKAAINVVLKNDPNNFEILYHLYDALSCSYYEVGDFQKMIKYKKYAFILGEKIWKDKKGRGANAYYVFGYRLMKMGFPKSISKEYIIKALEYANHDPQSAKRQISLIYKALGDLNFSDDVCKSEEYYQIALENAARNLKEISGGYKSNVELFGALNDFAEIFDSSGQLEEDNESGSKHKMMYSVAYFRIASKHLQKIFSLWNSESELFDGLEFFAKIFISYGHLLREAGRNIESDILFKMSYEIKTVNIRA